MQALASQYAVQVAAPEEIHRLAVDVYCPCAMGGTLNDQTIPELRCKIVCGSANNQLAEDRHGELLDARGILYAPDYIVNAGGVTCGLDSLNPGGFNYQRAMEKVGHLYDAMASVIAIAKEQHVPTYRAADLLAERRIEQGRRVKRLANYKIDCISLHHFMKSDRISDISKFPVIREEHVYDQRGTHGEGNTTGGGMRWGALAALFLATAFIFANMYTTQAILPVLSQDFGVSAPTAGLTISVLVLAVAVGSLLYGPLSDRIGRKPVMVGVSLLVTIPTCCAASRRISLCWSCCVPCRDY